MDDSSKSEMLLERPAYASPERAAEARVAAVRPASEGSTRLVDDLLLAFTLALSICYVPLTLAYVLSAAGLPLETVALASTLSIGVGCLWSGIATGVPLVVAPAMGMAVVITSATTSEEFTGRQALQSCAVAGLVVFLLSVAGKTSWRRRALDSIPKEIQLGIQAGVGVVLLEASLKMVRGSVEAGGGAKASWVLFALALCGLLLANVFAERLERQLRVDRLPFVKKLEYVLLRGAPILTAIALILAWNSFFSGTGRQPAGSCTLFIGQHLLTLPDNFESAMIGVHITIVAAFLLITDIPGTPYLLCRDHPNFDRVVERSFRVDSVMAMANAIVGTAPSVYYAENNVTHYFRRTAGRPAILVGVLFAVIALVALHGGGNGLLDFIPNLAVAPLVAFIGITVVAHSVVRKPGQDGALEGEERPRAYWFYMPTAVMIFLTPVIDLQFSLPVGILVYWLYGLVEKREGNQPAFVAISVIAGFVVILRFLLWCYG